MPELPEVETTCRGIRDFVEGQTVSQVVVREPRLRYPVPATLAAALTGQVVDTVARRGKYILLHCQAGTVIMHLGMSGRLSIVTADVAAKKHDHVDICLDDGHCLRFHDPRRFGAVCWTRRDSCQHRLLAALGPEPLSTEFGSDYLYQAARGRRLAVKSFIMDSHVVVGVGNIYANEALFAAGIHPQRAAGHISLARYDRLAAVIKQVLTAAIAQGGTTLRDFYQADSQPGYFKQQLAVYARADLPCIHCATPLRLFRQAQRASYYCPRCQH